MRVKSVLLGMLVIASSAAFSQNSNLRKAKNSYSKFDEMKSIGSAVLGVADLNSAKEALEKAIEHEKTKDQAETWTYYALVNADLALLDSTEASEAYFQKAVEARDKAISLDQNKENEQHLAALNPMLAHYELIKGVEAWGKEDFEGAHQAFEHGLAYLPSDTTFLYYSGLAASNAQLNDKALERLIELVPIDSFSDNDKAIMEISRIYLAQGDTINAIKYAEIGANKYPGHFGFIQANLQAGNAEKTIDFINQQIAKEPDNDSLYYLLGISYNEINDIDKSETAYKKALEINPDYLEANINLGGLILNRGIDYLNKTNNAGLPQEEYEAEIQKAYDIVDTALPVLEKAVEVDGSSYLALTNLRKYYEIKDKKDKIAELQARIDALQ